MAGSSTREIITLQFGHYANFVGTQWWNIQESSFCYDPTVSFQQEINHDVLFREGLTLHGDQTFTPRVLMFDLKGSLKTLPQYGTLYQTPSYSSEAAWSEKMSVHKADPEPKNEFQMDLEAEEPEAETAVTYTDNRTLDRDSRTLDRDSSSGVTEDNKNPREKYYNLDKDISVWSDFLGTCLHPKSVQVVRDFLHEESANPFNVFGYGQGIIKDEHFYDEFENSLHFFVEECDRLQGFQIFADVYNGFGGLSSQVLEELRDEYGTKSFLTFGVAPTAFSDGTHKDTAYRILNSALSYGNLSQHSDLFIPLSLAREAWPRMRQAREFPLLTYKPALSYHTSAILGVCVDTITMPYRLLTSQAANMSSFVDSVAFGERKMASLDSTFPLPVEETVPLASLLGSKLHRSGQELLQSVTPGVSNSSFVISQSAVIRGIPASLTHNPLRNVQTQNPSQHENPFEVCSAANEIVQTFLQNLHPQTNPVCWNVNQACMVKPPFPNIFAPRVSSDGSVIEGYARPEGSRVNQTSVLSRVETNSGIASMLLSLIQWAKKVNINKHHLFLESGTEAETFKEMLEDLTNLSERYDNP